jgi:mannose-6-phosphate isomerase-like protein (cupin superfamily)
MSTTKNKFDIEREITSEQNFNKKYIMKHTYVKKEWGHEVWFANNDLYCGKELYIKRWSKSSNGNFHFHKVKDETFYVIKGRVFLDVIDESMESVYTYILKEGDSFKIKPLLPHRFRTGFRSCTFIEASTFHDDADSYYIE